MKCIYDHINHISLCSPPRTVQALVRHNVVRASPPSSSKTLRHPNGNPAPLAAASPVSALPDLRQPPFAFCFYRLAYSEHFTRRGPYNIWPFWNRLPLPSSGDFPDPGIEPASPALAGGFFTTESPGKPHIPFLVSFNPYNSDERISISST